MIKGIQLLTAISVILVLGAATFAVGYTLGYTSIQGTDTAAIYDEGRKSVLTDLAKRGQYIEQNQVHTMVATITRISDTEFEVEQHPDIFTPLIFDPKIKKTILLNNATTFMALRSAPNQETPGIEQGMFRETTIAAIQNGDLIRVDSQNDISDKEIIVASKITKL